MDKSLLVCLHDILWEKNTLCDILRYLTCHIITLNGIYGRVLITVLLLNFFVIALNKRENLVICSISLSDKRTGVAVSDVSLSYLKCTLSHNLILNDVLNLLYGECSACLCNLKLDKFCNVVNLATGKLFLFARLIGFRYGYYDFV